VEAEKAAFALSTGPTRAYGEMRRLLSRALGNPFESQLEDEAQSLARVAGSRDAREGITAFTQKRRPVFHGQ
jgi:2-(1,2-epoxy-1,2-dihydrophenyl)acetyl-CoA isomerase